MSHCVTWQNVMWQKIEENLFQMISPVENDKVVFSHPGFSLCCVRLWRLFITTPQTFRNYDSGLKRNTLSCFIIEFYQVDLKCDITSTSSLQRSFPKPANICNDFVAIGQVLSSWEDRVRFSKFISSYFSHSFSGISLFIRLIILEPHWHPIIPFYIIDYV